MSGDSGINEDMLSLIQEINNGNFNSTIFENQPLENDTFNVLPGFTISDDFDLGIGMDPIHSQSLEDMLKPGLHTVASDIGSGLHTVDLSTVDELTPSSSSQSLKSNMENNYYNSNNSGIEASDLGSLLEQFEEVSNSASSTGSAMTPKKEAKNLKGAGSVYMFKSIAAPKSLLSTMSLPASPVSTPPSTPPPEVINKIKASNRQKSAILIPAVTAPNKPIKTTQMELHKSQSQPELKLSIQSGPKPKVMQSTPKTGVPVSNPKTEVPLSKSLAPLGLETKKKSIMLEVLTWDKEKNPAPLSKIHGNFQNKDTKDKISINLMCNGKDKKSLTNILEQNGKSQILNRKLNIEKETKKRASPITLEEYKERRKGRLDGRGSGSCSPISTEVKRTSSPSLPNAVLTAIPDQILVDHGYSTIQPSPKMIKQVSEEVDDNIDNKDAQPDAAIIKQLSEHIGGMIEVAFNTKQEASEPFGTPPIGQSNTGSGSSSRDDTSSTVDVQPDNECMDVTEELASSTPVKSELQEDEPMNVMEEEPMENVEENIVEFEIHDSPEPESGEIQQLSEDVSIIVETDAVNDIHIDEAQVDVSSVHVEIKTEDIDLQTDIVEDTIDTETVSNETTIQANDAVSEVDDAVRGNECNEFENNNKTTLEETMNSENMRYSKFKNEKSSSSKECLRGRSHRGRGQKRAYRKRDTSPGSDNDVYFDKIPQYFTALTKPEKPPKKTSDIKLTSMYHDDIDRDRSPIREDDTFDKVPSYYSCFTNSTKYDSTGPMTIHDVNRHVSSAVSSRSNSPLVIDSRAVSRVNSRASSRSSSRSSSSSSGSCSSCYRGSSYSRSRSRSHSRRSRPSRRHSRSMSRDRNRRSKRNKRSRSYRSRSRSHISRSHRSRSRSYRSRSRRSRSYRSRSRSYRSRSRSYRSRSRSYSPGRRYQSRRENRYNIPDRSRNGRPLDEGRDKHLKIEERRIVYVGRIGSNCVPKDLERRFERFGPIDKVTVHFRENGDNYGFVTFTYSCDAYACVEKGNDIPGERKYDLCFGGRREFCKTDYLDLDSKAEEEEWYGPQEPKQSASLDFDALLKQTMSKLKKKKS